MGAGTPSLIHVRLTLSPSLTVVFAGGCMITGIDGTTAVWRERELFSYSGSIAACICRIIVIMSMC